MPSSWPGAFGAYKYSRDAVRVNIVPIIVIWLIDFTVTAIIEWKLGNVGELIAYLLGGLIGVAITLLYIGGVRRQRMSIGETFSKSIPLMLKMIVLQLLITVSLMISLILLVIPFFIVWPRLTLAPYYLVDKDMGILEAYKASWAAGKGNVGKIYGIYFAAVPMVLLVFTVIGIPVAIYLLTMYSAVTAVLYEFINKQSPLAPANGSFAAPPPVTPAQGLYPSPPPPPTNPTPSNPVQ